MNVHLMDAIAATNRSNGTSQRDGTARPAKPLACERGAGVQNAGFWGDPRGSSIRHARPRGPGDEGLEYPRGTRLAVRNGRYGHQQGRRRFTPVRTRNTGSGHPQETRKPREAGVRFCAHCGVIPLGAALCAFRAL
ncbi:MAG TPA: hypothetical protein VNY05_16845 [Candidatus Acidoferrales bacterium]|jgi:hypothetical protein|nr:hypothetical protein [Candidatus Acidoferrales bacterium]